MKYFIIAGEASGDLHASNLMRELKIKDSNAEFCFLGGDLMLAQGGVQVKDYRDMAFMGFIAVIKNARKVLQNFRDCETALLEFKPDVLILVDYPSFNLKIARYAKKHLRIPVYYYISPKIWAWKEYRIKSIKKYVDRMFTIFPFETDFYAKHDYQVEYVGNPSVDSISSHKNQLQTFDEFRSLNRLSSKEIIALLPGSRKQEITACLPKMIKAASRFSSYQIVVSGAPGIDESFYHQLLPNNAVKIIFNQTYELLRQSKAVVVNSGTATLETALMEIPQVVVYHVAFGRLAYWLKGLLIKTKYISLVNLISNEETVKELIAHLFTEENIEKELGKLLSDETYRTKMISSYVKVKNTLGKAGTANRAAEKILNYLTQDAGERNAVKF